jgi:hypothetical protein
MESWVIIRAELHRDNNVKGLSRALIAVALLVVAQFVLVRRCDMISGSLAWRMRTISEMDWESHDRN